MVSRLSSLAMACALLCVCAIGCKGSSPDPGAGNADAAPNDQGIADSGVAPHEDAAMQIEDAASEDAGSIADAEAIEDAAALEDAGMSASHACADHNYKLCEDFENAAADGMPPGWTRVFPYWPDPSSAKPAEVFVSKDQPHWGMASLESTSDVCAQTRAEHDLVALGATANHHWGRAFFAVNTPAPESDPNGNGWYHTTMVALRGDNSGGGDTNECRIVDMVESAFDQSVHFLYNVPDDSCCDSMDVNPYEYRYENVWHCAEWYVDVDTNSYRFFLDGTELLSFTEDMGARLSSCDRSLSVGALCYAPPRNAPQNLTTWIDDVAIDDNRIGCE